LTVGSVYLAVVLDEEQFANPSFIEGEQITRLKADFMIASSSYKKIKELLKQL